MDGPLDARALSVVRRFGSGADMYAACCVRPVMAAGLDEVREIGVLINTPRAKRSVPRQIGPIRAFDPYAITSVFTLPSFACVPAALRRRRDGSSRRAPSAPRRCARSCWPARRPPWKDQHGVKRGRIGEPLRWDASLRGCWIEIVGHALCRARPRATDGPTIALQTPRQSRATGRRRKVPRRCSCHE
jgi:hypothetical protein